MDDILIEAAGLYREEIRIPTRTQRKLAGSTLCLSIFVYLILLPLALIGQLFTLSGRLLKLPLKRLGLWILPAAVRLWYIHRVGRLHPWQCAKSRNKQKLGAHSRSIRVDVVASTGRLVSVHTLPQLHDNYAYLVVNTSPCEVAERGRVYRALVIDAGDALEVTSQLQSIQAIHYRDGEIQLECILTTHHHWDHMGGNEKLLELHPTISLVCCGRRDRVVCANRSVREGDVLELLDACEIYCHETPAHTLGSITYRLKSLDHDKDCLFLGDTFFIGGSGANFEGDLPMMVQNFNRLYLTSSPNTLLFPGHEYSERIMSTLFPEQAAELIKTDWLRYQVLAAQYARIIHLRNLPHPAPTVPVSLNIEVNYNPHFTQVIDATRTLMAAIYTYINSKSVQAPPPTEASGIPPRPGRCESQLASGDGLQNGLERAFEEAAAAVRSENPMTSASTVDTSLKWDRMTPRIAMSDGRCMLVEPPWILASEMPTSMEHLAPTVARGFELFYNPKRLLHSAMAINDMLSPLYLPHANGSGYVVSLAMLEKCARSPMGTGFPGLDVKGAALFRWLMVLLLQKEAGGVTGSNAEGLALDVNQQPMMGGPYLSSESLLAFVVTTLRPTLSQVCKIYGKKFKDYKPAEHESAPMPILKHHSSVAGGALLAMGGSGPKIPYHDFTECQLCNARAIYVRGQPIVLQKEEAVDSDSVLKRRPTTLSVLDCMVQDTQPS